MSENHPSEGHDTDRSPDDRDGYEPFHEPEVGPAPALHPHSPAQGRRLSLPESAVPAFCYERRLLVSISGCVAVCPPANSPR